MKTRLLVGLIFTNVFVFALFAEADSQTIQIENPGEHQDIQPAIQKAVDSASDGTTIVLPAGEFVFNNSITIHKFVSMKGQGLKKTALYRDSAPAPAESGRFRSGPRVFISYETQSDEPSGIVVSGINFRSRKPAVLNKDGSFSGGGVGIRFSECVDFLVENCRFEYFGSAGIEVRHKDTLARGLIRHNEFYYNAGNGLGYGVSVYGTNDQWVADPKFGTNNFIFIEDNVFDYHRHSMAAGGCGLYVFRYNLVLNNSIATGGHAIDTHEARGGRGGNRFGTRAVEVYHNKLYNAAYKNGDPIQDNKNKGSLEESAVGIRSGDALVYDNEVKGYLYAVWLSNWTLRNDTKQPYPVPYSPGYLSGLALGPDHVGTEMPQGDGDVFVWNNTNDPYLTGHTDPEAVFMNSRPDWWKEGRDYHFAPKPGYKPYPYPYPYSAKQQEAEK